MEGDNRVGFPCDGIFVRECAGIKGIFRRWVAIPLIKGERELPHLLLIVTEIAEGGIVRSPHHRAICGKLLLISPVRDTVDDLVIRAILRDRHFRIVIYFLDIDVVIRYERHHPAIRREHRGLLLFELLGEGAQDVALDFKHIPVSLE